MKGPQGRKQTQGQIEKEWASSVGFFQRHRPQHPHHVKVSPWGQSRLDNDDDNDNDDDDDDRKEEEDEDDDDDDGNDKNDDGSEEREDDSDDDNDGLTTMR